MAPFVFLTVVSKKDEWVEQLKTTYKKKISAFHSFTIEEIKDNGQAREQRDQKVKASDKNLLKRIQPKDFVVVFDERGAGIKDSIAFARKMQTFIESGKQRIVFVIGGAFGVGEELRTRADFTISLSALTLSHQVALAVALEQIFRALTILKNIPYHNE